VDPPVLLGDDYSNSDKYPNCDVHTNWDTIPCCEQDSNPNLKTIGFLIPDYCLNVCVAGLLLQV
jgi:hypothetical protein